MTPRPKLQCARCDKPAGYFSEGEPVVIQHNGGVHVCWECFDRWLGTPEGTAYDQALTAIERLDRSSRDYLRWPWADVAAITGNMAPGQRPYFFCAFSGNDKTAFSASAVSAWTEAGIPGYVLSLETPPDAYRVHLACLRLALNPAWALTGKLREMEDAGDKWAREQRQRIKDELRRQYVEWADLLHLSKAETVNRRGLEAEFKQAAAIGCRYILVDHIDHVEPDGRGTPVAESMAVNRDLVKLAQRYDLVPVIASQLNMDIAKVDGLSKYRPPKPTDLMFPAVKTQVAAAILGLYRPLADDADADLIARAKRHEVDPYKAGVLKEGAMGAVVMKIAHADGDAHEGARTELAVRHGRVMTRDEAARLVGPPKISSQHYGQEAA